MSVVAANSAVNTPQHKATAEQIRLAQLIEDKKHDHPEVQEMLRNVLDVVPNSNQDDALLALFDCDYDFERTVALLIEKGHDVASEWRTATNHKVSKKQQKTTGSHRTGHEGETDENGQQQQQQQQQQQRGNDGYHARGKSRGGGGRSRYPQQTNGNESPNVNTQQNENYSGQTKSRGASGGGSGYRGRGRGQNRGGSRPNDRNYQQQTHQQGHDPNLDNSVPSDTTSRTHEGSYSNRRGAGVGATGNRQNLSQPQQQPHQTQDQWDVGNWNGETLIYSRTTKDEEPAFNAESVSSKTLTEVSNGQTIPSAGSTANPNMSERDAQQTSSSEFDPVEAARQIKNVIGIGHAQQGHASSTSASQTKSLMDLKPLITDSSANASNKPKPSTGHTMTSKVTPTPSPAPRIPHQPVVFSDRFDGGLSKIDVEFGNLDEGFDEKHANKHPVNVPVSSAFYPNNDPMALASKLNNNSTSTSTTMPNNAARLTNLAHHPSNEQTSFISPTGISTATRPNEQLPVMNQQRLLPSQQASMAMKTVVSPVAYAVHQAQPPMNTPNMALRSLFYHHQQQEPVPLDNTYDPTAFPLQSTDFTSPYFMTTINPAASQQQGQPHYLVPQSTVTSQAPPQGQVGNNRQSGSTTVPTSSVQTTSAPTATSSASTKKAPAVPPGIFIPSAAPPAQAGYSTGYPPAYGVPLSVGGQQQNAPPSYAPLYDAEHSFTNSFMQFANPQQAQSPSGTYGSVTPPVQQQGTHANNDNKAISYQGQHMTENLLLLQQFSIRQSNNQGQGQQGVTHSPAQMSYYLGHPPAATSYSPVHPVMYAQAATPMTQQQQPTGKQQGQHYNQSSGMTTADDYYARNAAPSSSSSKEGQYMYSNSSGQAQQGANQSAGQSSGPNKQQGGQQQQQQRANNNTYHNQSNPTRSYR